MSVYLNPLQGKLWRSPAGFPRYFFNPFQGSEFSKYLSMLDEMYSDSSLTSCFLGAAMVIFSLIGGHPYTASGGKAMAGQHKSNFRKIVQALAILNPQQINDPINASDIAAVTDLSVKQASPCLSILRSLGYLAKVGSAHRYSCYIRTLKPLTATPASLLRTYRAKLTRQKPANYNAKLPDDSTENLPALANTPTKMLVQRSRSPYLPTFSEQLSLFPLSHASASRSRGKENRTARRG